MTQTASEFKLEARSGHLATETYKLVKLANGTSTVHADAYAEKMHPGLGPAAEAEALYVRQLKIRERLQQSQGEFVVWDVGLGAAANALTLLQLTRDLPCPLRIVSFDDTAGPAAFALAHVSELGYFHGYAAPLQRLLEHGSVKFNDGPREVNWKFHLGDFPAWLERRSLAGPAATDIPHAIFFDAFSPAKNPSMWTLPLFTNLFRQLDPTRPCSLTTYSRSTMLRVTLLLAGFYVGQGIATGLKEETTVAANSLSLLETPLHRNWLERAQRSDSAEPLSGSVYRKSSLQPETWQRLCGHPQFQ